MTDASMLLQGTLNCNYKRMQTAVACTWLTEFLCKSGMQSICFCSCILCCCVTGATSTSVTSLDTAHNCTLSQFKKLDKAHPPTSPQIGPHAKPEQGSEAEEGSGGGLSIRDIREQLTHYHYIVPQLGR